MDQPASMWPLSTRETYVWPVPARSASSFCVMPALSRKARSACPSISRSVFACRRSLLAGLPRLHRSGKLCYATAVHNKCPRAAGTAGGVAPRA